MDGDTADRASTLLERLPWTKLRISVELPPIGITLLALAPPDAHLLDCPKFNFNLQPSHLALAAPDAQDEGHAAVGPERALVHQKVFGDVQLQAQPSCQPCRAAGIVPTRQRGQWAGAQACSAGKQHLSIGFGG